MIRQESRRRQKTCCQTSNQAIQAIALPRPLIGDKDHGVVFSEGPAQGDAELVLVQHSSRLPLLFEEIVVRIQGRIPEILPDVSVKCVCTRLGHDVDVRARVSSIGSVVLPDLDLKLLKRIWIRARHAPAKRPLTNEAVYLTSIHLEIVVLGRIAANRLPSGVGRLISVS